MRIIECEQRSPEWYAVRQGIPTASAFDKIITSKGEPSKSRKGYLYTLAAERISGTVEETFVSLNMQQGIDREEEARLVFSMHREVSVEEVGFCLSDDDRYGCSPDGLIEADGLLEIKCPSGKVAVEYLLKGKLPTAYIQQIQGQLLVTERKWIDFASYFPGLPLFIVRVERDEAFLGKLEKELATFCSELYILCDQLERVKR